MPRIVRTARQEENEQINRALAHRAVRGDAEAREELIVRLLPVVKKIALHWKNLDMEVRDVVSEGTIELIRAIDDYDPAKEGNSVAGYVAFRVKNHIGHVYQHGRRQKRRPRGRRIPLHAGLNVAAAGRAETGTELEEARRHHERLIAVLSRLTERQRQVILLRHFPQDGRAQTYREIAAQMGMTRQAAQVAHDRALRALRAQLNWRHGCWY